jgi:tRNA threonylcarbamoyladenosine biosynthesis protein TsaB
LVPLIRDTLHRAGKAPSEIRAVAVTAGPGSFTGLRIGVTTAKALAYAVGAQLVGLDTLEVIANQSPPVVSKLVAAVDAHRGEVFARRFVRDERGWMTGCEPARVLSVAEWGALFEPGTFATGPALWKFTALPAEIDRVDSAFWSPTALGVGRVALQRLAAGQTDDPFQVVPHYIRPSAAEEKRASG